MRIDKNTITWDREDWLAGLVPNHSASLLGNQRDMNGFGSARQINPFRFIGGISPGFVPSDFTNVSVVDTALRKGVENGDKAYFVGGDNVHEITISTKTLTTPADHTITISGSHSSGGHTTPVADDIALYRIGSTLYAFYSWSDNTDGDVGRFDLSSTYSDNFMSATAASGAVLATTNPHPLAVGTDDILYIGDGSNVHAFDGQTGANGTYSQNVFKLPKDYVVTGMTAWNDLFAIAAYKNPSGTPSANRGISKVFIYEYASEDPTYIKDLNDWYVSDVFVYKGTLACFTQGRVSDSYLLSVKISRLQILQGTEFDEVATFVDNAPIRGGHDVVGDQILWNSSGVIYSWGSPLKGIKAGLHKLGEGSGTTSGALRVFTSGITLISTGTTTSGGCQDFNSNYTASNTSFATCLASPLFPEGMIGEITKVRVEFFKTSTAGRGVNISLFDGFGNLSEISGAVTRTLTTIASAQKVKEYTNDIYGAVFFHFKDLKLQISYGDGTDNTDAPIIEKITVFFKPVKTNL